jgi:hypothetical protein
MAKHLAGLAAATRSGRNACRRTRIACASGSQSDARSRARNGRRATHSLRHLCCDEGTHPRRLSAPAFSSPRAWRCRARSGLGPETPVVSAVNAEVLSRAAAGAENGSFAGTFSAKLEAAVLLAVQKVEGSNPISRSRKGLHLRLSRKAAERGLRAQIRRTSLRSLTSAGRAGARRLLRSGGGGERHARSVGGEAGAPEL